jgi:predicted RNase H-like nuclease (RuvC/YqgF family)
MPDLNNIKYDPETKRLIGKDAHLEIENVKALLKDIDKRYPPYQVKSLRAQIREFRAEEEIYARRIKELRAKVTEWQRLSKLCEARDKEAAPLIERLREYETTGKITPSTETKN